MKSIRQRLQSRISVRRNFIRTLEIEAEGFKRHLTALQPLNTPLALRKKEAFRQSLGSTRTVLKDLHNDQKLDKELYRMVLQEERMARFDEAYYSHMPVLSFLGESAPAVLEIIGEKP